MGKTSHLQIEARMEKAEEAYRRTLSDMAVEYRNEVLIPMCIDTGFSYCTVNGDFWFEKGEKEVRDNWDADEHKVPFLKAYIDTLNLPDGLRGVFGDHVESVKVSTPIAESRLLRTPVPVEVDVLDGPERIDRAVAKSLKRKGKKA
jgi:hypothetical protein